MPAPHTVVVAAPADSTRDQLESFLTAHHAQVPSLRQEMFPRAPLIAIEQDALLVDGVDALAEARAAVVLDSGMMWPVPMLDPSLEQWEHHRHRCAT